MPKEFLMFCLLMMVVIQLAGCGAVYSYERTADSCKLTIVSAREVIAGDITLDENCAIIGRADSLNNNEKAFDAIGELVKKIP